MKFGLLMVSRVDDLNMNERIFTNMFQMDDRSSENNVSPCNAKNRHSNRPDRYSLE